jgi:hypothetical protein
MKDFREFLSEADDLSISKYGHEEIEIVMRMFCERMGIPEKGYRLPFSEYKVNHQILTIDYWVLGNQVYPNREEAYEKFEMIKEILKETTIFQKMLQVDTSIYLTLENFKPELKQDGEISFRSILRYFKREGIDIDKELENRRGKITSKKTGIA